MIGILTIELTKVPPSNVQHPESIQNLDFIFQLNFDMNIQNGYSKNHAGFYLQTSAGFSDCDCRLLFYFCSAILTALSFPLSHISRFFKNVFWECAQPYLFYWASRNGRCGMRKMESQREHHRKDHAFCIFGLFHCRDWSCWTKLTPGVLWKLWVQSPSAKFRGRHPKLCTGNN